MVDEYGLSRALSGRLLTLLVGAMVVLASLGIGGTVAALSLAREWRQGAGSVLMVEVPRPAELIGRIARADQALALLQGSDAVQSAHLLGADEVNQLLRPWLGGDMGALGLQLPAMIEVHLADASASPDALISQVTALVPGTVAETSDDWSGRLLALGRSLAACAGLAVVLVLAVAVALVALAANAGLAEQRDTIDILHLLGATDGDIARRFATRLATLAVTGGIGGAVVALPLLIELARLAAPFGVAPSDQVAAQPLSMLTLLPMSIWVSLIALPLGAAAIGWGTAQIAVRLWLRRLP
jgi:cell division transport system permease protein